MLAAKGLRWNYLKKKQGIVYSFKDSFLMYTAGMYIGILTPGRLGEITKALYLKKDGHSMGKSLVGAVLDRIIDLFFLLIFVFLGALFFLADYKKQVMIFAGGLIVAIFLFMIFLKIGLINWFLNKIFIILVPKKYRDSWKTNFQDFINDFKIYNLKDYIYILVITVISWILYYLQMYVLAKGININVSFFYLSLSITVAGFITLIPISISGIGTRDAALILMLTPFSIDKSRVIAFSALVFLMSIVIALTGLICWLIKPIRFKNI
jgi:uncharacterized protein (TIRG00374 family)